LLRRRLALGLGLREAAKRIGITAARLSELEQGSVEAHGKDALGVMLGRLEAGVAT
jgi:transcriptional regulator with XRE-family HTH domain